LQAAIPAGIIPGEGSIASLGEVDRILEASECFVPDSLVSACAIQQG